MTSTAARNKVFNAMQVANKTFAHFPKNDATTCVIKEFDAEGLVRISEIHGSAGMLWEVERLWQ